MSRSIPNRLPGTLLALSLGPCACYHPDWNSWPATTATTVTAATVTNGPDDTGPPDPSTDGATTTHTPPTGSDSLSGAGDSASSGEDAASGSTGLATTDPLAPECGDGHQQGMEECDDGNQVDGDGCENGCVKTAVCGNGLVEVGESCDDNNTEEDDDCSGDCQTVTTPVICGDGVQEDDEQCDDGNDTPADGCEPNCTITPPECGNGKVEAGEQCDDGNLVNGGPNDFCKNDCTPFVPPQCKAPADYLICDKTLNLADKNDKTSAHKAMGICNAAPDNSVQIANFSFNSINNAAWQVAKGFGSYQYDHDANPVTADKLYYSPREGDALLMISTGVIKAPGADGVVVELNNSQGGQGDNGNDDSNTLPPPFRHEMGSNNGTGGTPFQGCDGLMFRDCSDTLQAQWIKGGSNPNDKLWFSFTTTVPLGTFGYSFDFVFCSSEWPTWVNTGFNDLLIVYQVDPAADDPNADPPIDPYSGNVAFIPDPNNPMKGLPLTITSLDPYFKGPGFTGYESPLQGTGFQNHACTEWLMAKGGVQPGSTITIAFFLADMGDSILATVALLDNFRWDCEGCVPSEVDDCGIQEPV